MTQTLKVPQGQFKLSRYPLRIRETLRAWDAADEMLLEYLAQTIIATNMKRTLILNDGFGALTVALAKHHPITMSDSILSLRGIRENLQSNNLDSDELTLLNSTESLQQEYKLVLIKIPKSLAQLEAQLHMLRAHITADTIIVAAGMAKSIHTSTLNLFETIIGPTKTSLAKKKARLVFSRVDENLAINSPPGPVDYELGDTGYRIISYAGVFSQQGLDIGSRFLMEHIPATNDSKSIIDLGCGNGVLGLVAAIRNPHAHITFIDESYQAIASARATFNVAFSNTREADFQVANSLENIRSGSIDCILNNPPFHQHNATGDTVAWQMFNDAYKALRQGAELWVVGNRHLAYHTKLKRVFGNYINIASNKKFVILKAIKR